MSTPQQPQPPTPSKVSHFSIECSWEEQLAEAAASADSEAGRLRAELQLAQFSDNWEAVYKGYDTRCVCGGLNDDTEYQLRLRFGNAHGWGEFSACGAVRTAKKPFSGEDIHKQIRRRNIQQLKVILEKREANVNAPDDKGFTPISAAALEGLIEYCDLLLEFRADVNSCSDNGKTSLMLVAYKGKQESADWLIANGASPHARDRKGLAPLHYAVDGEQPEMVRLLLDSGADIHAKDNRGCTALLRCAMHKNNGNVTVAMALVQRGAHIDETDAQGQTALFYCVINKHEQLAAALLRHNANPLITNSKGVSPMKAADGMHDAKQLREMLRAAVQQQKASSSSKALMS